MASSYSELYALEYTGAVDNSGNGVRAQFSFQGIDRGSSFQVGSTWPVSFDNTDGPMCALLDNNQLVTGVTANILTSAPESGGVYNGTLEMYPLTAGTTYTLQVYTEGGTPTITISFTPNLNTNPRAKNLASGTLAESISASTATIYVYVGEGSASTIASVWPDTPFYASIMPANPSAGVANFLDSEIVKVTNVSTDQVGNTALSIVRGQRGTTSKAFTAGAVVTNANYAEDAVLLGDEGSTEGQTPWIGVADIIWSQMVNKIYPVGSIFMSATLSTATAVGNALGGTWEEWGTGRVPVGVDTSDADFEESEIEGGEKEHTLTTSEMPRHNHTLSFTANSTGVGTTRTYGTVYSTQNQSIIRNNTIPTTGELAYWGIDYTGSGQSHNNLQPYITCYMYKRIA